MMRFDRITIVVVVAIGRSIRIAIVVPQEIRQARLRAPFALLSVDRLCVRTGPRRAAIARKKAKRFAADELFVWQPRADGAVERRASRQNQLFLFLFVVVIVVIVIAIIIIVIALLRRLLETFLLDAVFVEFMFYFFLLCCKMFVALCA
jgi:hypothetical protein